MTASSSKRRIFLGMPTDGTMTIGAARGFYRATRTNDPYQICNAGSLLCANFNGLWATALNYQHHCGERITHFAMQHNDIEPEDYWVDTLIDELESKNLDVLGVVAPIKDARGVSSTALHREGDNWRPLCRLTMREVHRLPGTFTSSDLGYPLLINTGCWICRFDPTWNTKICFDDQNEIVRVPDGRYFAQVEPEDWYISRIFHELGLRIGATRKVRLQHSGLCRYTNEVPWGMHAYDSEYTDKHMVPQSDYEFPHDVRGWLSVKEGEALRDLAHGKRVLEIGSYCGRSTVCIAQSAREVVCVDYFDGRSTPDKRDTRQEFDENLRRYQVADKVQVIHPDADIPMPEYDLVLIDGDHAARSVQRDMDRALSRLASGGLIAFHDYRQYRGQYDGRWDPGVTQVVDELVANGASILCTHDSLAVVRPPAQFLQEV